MRMWLARAESLGIGSCLANGIQLRRRPMLRVRLSLSWEKTNDSKCLRLLFDSDAEEVGESKEVSCGRRALQRKQLEFETEQKILMQ